MAEFVCIIPARGGSKGIPGKNIALVGGKPLIAWSIERALASKYLGSKVYVTSDSDEILDVARGYGAKGISRPAELSSDAATSESAITHALQVIEKEGVRPDYVVFLQATSPLRAPDHIDLAIERLLSEKGDSLFSAMPVKDFFLWGKRPDTFFSKNFDYRNRKRRQDLETSWLENGSIYVFKRSLLEKETNRLGGKICVLEMDRIHSIQIDEPDDLEMADYFLRKGNR